MSEAGGSALLKVLWFVVRLIIYLITGHWVGGRPGEPDTEQPVAPAAAPATTTAAPKQVPPPRVMQDQERPRLLAWIEAARVRVPELLTAARGVPAGAAVASALQEAVFPEIERLRRQLIGRDALPVQFGQSIQAVDDALNAAAASIEARRAPATARALADSEAIAAELLEPLEEHVQSGTSRAGRVLLALQHVDGVRAQRVAANTRLLLVRNFASEPERLIPEARALARTAVEDLPALVDDLRKAQRLPAHVFAPPAQGTYDADTARGVIGVWLPELWADVMATFMLGPVYARFATAALSRPQAPLEARVAYIQGRQLSTRPPALVRVFVMSRALAELGFHPAAEQLWNHFVAQHGDDTLYFPRADGSVVPIPSGFVLGELEGALTAILEEPHRALLDTSLLDVPGFAFLHGEDGEARKAAEALARGDAVAHSPRVVAAAALLALEAQPQALAVIVDALARSVRGAGTLEAIGGPSSLRTAQTKARSLKAMAHDRTELQAALVLGAVFERPRGVRRGA